MTCIFFIALLVALSLRTGATMAPGNGKPAVDSNNDSGRGDQTAEPRSVSVHSGVKTSPTPVDVPFSLELTTLGRALRQSTRPRESAPLRETARLERIAALRAVTQAEAAASASVHVCGWCGWAANTAEYKKRRVINRRYAYVSIHHLLRQ